MELHLLIYLFPLISAIQAKHNHINEQDHYNNGDQGRHTNTSMTLLNLINDGLLRDIDWLLVVFTLPSLDVVRANGLDNGLRSDLSLLSDLLTL